MLNILRSLKIIYSMRHRLADGVWHDINQRYVGSLFGVIWVILFPLLQLSIYAALYTIIFKVRPSGLTEYGYVILVFSGLVPLLTFNEIVTATTNSLSMNKNLLLNTVFPSELIPLRAALASSSTRAFWFVNYSYYRFIFRLNQLAGIACNTSFLGAFIHVCCRYWLDFVTSFFSCERYSTWIRYCAYNYNGFESVCIHP